MKPRFPTMVFTDEKQIFFNDVMSTWHQKGQFEYKFKKVVRCYNFFQKWTILTQNSHFRGVTSELTNAGNGNVLLTFAVMLAFTFCKTLKLQLAFDSSSSQNLSVVPRPTLLFLSGRWQKRERRIDALYAPPEGTK